MGDVADLIARFREICGSEYVLTHPDALATYRSDGLLHYRQTPLAAVLPGTAAQVQKRRAGVLRGGRAVGRAAVPARGSREARCRSATAF